MRASKVTKFCVLSISITAMLLTFFLIKPQQMISNEVMDKKRVTTLKLRSLNKVFSAIKQDTGVYPDTSIGFAGIYQNWNAHLNWQGPYMQKKSPIRDSWNQMLIYKYPHNCEGKPEEFALYSVGENGIDECLDGDDIYIKAN